jgi:hypothetical protein
MFGELVRNNSAIMLNEQLRKFMSCEFPILIQNIATDEKANKLNECLIYLRRDLLTKLLNKKSKSEYDKRNITLVKELIEVVVANKEHYIVTNEPDKEVLDLTQEKENRIIPALYNKLGSEYIQHVEKIFNGIPKLKSTNYTRKVGKSKDTNHKVNNNSLAYSSATYNNKFELLESHPNYKEVVSLFKKPITKRTNNKLYTILKNSQVKKLIKMYLVNSNWINSCIEDIMLLKNGNEGLFLIFYPMYKNYKLVKRYI